MPVQTPTVAPPSAGARGRAARMASHPRAALITILTCQLMVVLDATIVNIALPNIQRSLKFSSADLSWVLNAYTLVFGGLLLLGARIGDLWGRRRTLITGIAIFTTASLLGGLAQNEAWLLAARAVQGVGGALSAPSALALLMTSFPRPKERTRALGFYTAVSIGGSAVGLLAGGMLTGWVSWRWVMFVNVPIGLVLIPLARTALVETPRSHGRGFDIGGALTSTLGVASLVYGFVRIASHSWTDGGALLSCGVGVVLLAVFAVTEAKVTSPITPLRLFASRNRNAANGARLFLIGGMQGMFFFLSQFLQEVLGYSAVITGLAFIPLTVVVFASSQVSSRRLGDIFTPKTLMLVGLAISAIGMLWLTQLDPHSSYGDLLGPMCVFGFGNGLAFVPLTTAALHGVEPADSGAASGLLNVTQQVGGSLGLALLVTVFGTTSRHAHSPAGTSAIDQAKHAFSTGADHAFQLAAVFVVVAFIATAALIRGIARPTDDVPHIVEM
jgi:EmrB/QacA subfamily drug resistance transporter